MSMGRRPPEPRKHNPPPVPRAAEAELKARHASLERAYRELAQKYSRMVKENTPAYALGNALLQDIKDGVAVFRDDKLLAGNHRFHEYCRPIERWMCEEGRAPKSFQTLRSHMQALVQQPQEFLSLSAVPLVRTLLGDR